MKAFDHFGGRCNGCHQHAEFCSCDIDDEGNLIATNPRTIPKLDIDYPENGEYGYDED